MIKEYEAEDLKIAKKLFGTELLEESGDPIVCSIHDIFHDNESDMHNCIGCNLAGSIELINFYFSRIESYNDIRDAYEDLIIKLYLFVERISELFKIIKLPLELRKKEFVHFNLIHKWANFIKHPKAFMFCHDAKYSVHSKSTDENLIVDDSFVLKYYGGDKKNMELSKKLENHQSVEVVYPLAEDLINGFSTEVRKIHSLISNDKDYRRILHDKSTLEAYFEVEDKS